MGLEAFQGGSEHAAAREAAEQVRMQLGTNQACCSALSLEVIVADGSFVAGLQAAMDGDGKPAWLRGLMGKDGSADLLQEQTGASSEEEV